IKLLTVFGAISGYNSASITPYPSTVIVATVKFSFGFDASVSVLVVAGSFTSSLSVLLGFTHPTNRSELINTVIKINLKYLFIFFAFIFLPPYMYILIAQVYHNFYIVNCI